MLACLLHKEPRIGAPRDDFKVLGYVIHCACFFFFVLFWFLFCFFFLIVVFSEIAKLLSTAAVMFPFFTHVGLECFSNLVVQLSARLLQEGGEVASPGSGSFSGFRPRGSHRG